MKSVFDPPARNELIQRIQSLRENSTALWGKMNIHQMLNHCILCEEMFLGKKKYKRAFLGRLLGKTGLKQILKDEKPLGRNAPTARHFKIKESNGDLTAEKNKWISLLNEYANYTDQGFEHWFFGKMSKEQIGFFDYKHIDHHLRQFNA